MKKIMALFLVAVLMLGLVACGQSAAPAATEAPAAEAPAPEAPAAEAPAAEAGKDVSELKLAWLNPLLGFSLFNMQQEGVLKAAEDYGVSVDILGTSTLSTDDYAKEIENAIVLGYDGIVVNPYIESAFIPAIRKAKEAGMKIVYTIGDTPSAPELRDCAFYLDNDVFGATQAEAAAAACEGKGDVCWMQTSYGGVQDVYRAAFEAKLAEYPEMAMVVQDSCNGDAVVATEKFENIFTAYPDLKCVVCCDAAAATAAANVAEKMDFDVKIIAIDDIPETLDAIKAGTTWGTIAQNYVGMGYESIRWLVDAFAGEEVPAQIEVPLVLVTNENMDTYYDELVGMTKLKGTEW